MDFDEASLGSMSGAATACGNVLWCRGELDIATLPTLAGEMARVIGATATDVVLDLRDAEFIDASTVGFIVRADLVLRASARSLSVASPSARARRVLDLCGLEYVDGCVA